jgi:hypothetical protein
MELPAANGGEPLSGAPVKYSIANESFMSCKTEH